MILRLEQGLMGIAEFVVLRWRIDGKKDVMNDALPLCLGVMIWELSTPRPRL